MIRGEKDREVVDKVLYPHDTPYYEYDILQRWHVENNPPNSLRYLPNHKPDGALILHITF